MNGHFSKEGRKIESKNQSRSGPILAIFGSVILLFGVLMSLYEKVIYIDLPYGDNTIPISQAYPYQSIGIVMIIGGIIMIIIGAVLWNNKSKMKRKKIHFVSVKR